MNMTAAPTLQHYLGWGVPSWKRAIAAWDDHLSKKNTKNCQALELGSNRGGLSLYLAHKYEMNVVCSDLYVPEHARPLHKEFGIEDKITYKAVDVFNIDYPDNTFDYIICKSLLISACRGNRELQRQGVKEIHRVLKPGGTYLFAENLEGALLHRLARKMFVKWAHGQAYIHSTKIEEMFSAFTKLDYRTGAVLMPLLGNGRTASFFTPADNVVSSVLPKSCHYIVYGHAVK